MKTTAKPKPYASSATPADRPGDEPLVDEDDQVRIANDPEARRFRALKDWHIRLLEVGDQYVHETLNPVTGTVVRRTLVEVVKIDSSRLGKKVELSNKYKFNSMLAGYEDTTIPWIYRPLAKFREFSFH